MTEKPTAHKPCRGYRFNPKFTLAQRNERQGRPGFPHPPIRNLAPPEPTIHRIDLTWGAA